MENLKDMSNYEWLNERRRHRQLFIVEGNHEKEDLLKLLLRCFPELNIDIDDVIIYGTNIYKLYEVIDRAYPGEWSEQDIDLPLIVSQQRECETLYKYDFTNILIIFDYERHDPRFSVDKITKMQKYFKDITDVGQLYINYPMIESYQDFQNIPEDDFIDKKIPANLQPGKKYKNSVKDYNIAKMVNLYKKMYGILEERFSLVDSVKCNSCIEQMLNINDSESVKDRITNILNDSLTGRDLKTAIYQFEHILNKCGYLCQGDTYYTFMRKKFQYIIGQNILKAYKIQTELTKSYSELDKEILLSLNLGEILNKQNEFSRDIENGFIWILNTCILFIPEYNYILMN